MFKTIARYVQNVHNGMNTYSLGLTRLFLHIFSHVRILLFRKKCPFRSGTVRLILIKKRQLTEKINIVFVVAENLKVKLTYWPFPSNIELNAQITEIKGQGCRNKSWMYYCISSLLRELGCSMSMTWSEVMFMFGQVLTALESYS